MNVDNKLLLDGYLNKFPKVSLLIGKSTKDKMDCIAYLSSTLFVSADITENISYDFLNELYLSTDSLLYVIDLDCLSLQKQNVVLKFIEEPPTKCYVVLTSSSKAVLPTILTRCVTLELHNYTKDELRNYSSARGLTNTNIDMLIDISETVDDVEEFAFYNLDDVKGLCQNVISNISRATLPNALSIANKYIFLKQPEQNKYSLNLFISMMRYMLMVNFDLSHSKIVYYMYKALLSFETKLLNKSLSREYLLDQLLMKWWRISRGDIIED